MKLSLAVLPALLATAAEAITFSDLSAQQLVENYFNNPDDPVEFRNIAASDHSCFALFADGHSAGRHSLTNQFLVPNDGIILSTGNPKDIHMNDSDETTTDFGIDTGDIHLEHNVAQGAQVLDPCFIQFEFSCPDITDIYTPQVSFDYVFGSEEYLQKKKKEEEVENNELFNRGAHSDVLGFFLNGENIALVQDENGGMTSLSIEDVNEKKNTQYFIQNKLKNTTSTYSEIEADGFTTKLTAQGDAKPGWNIIKLAIADASDGNLDSWVLLEAGTFSCALGGAPKSFQPPSTVDLVSSTVVEEVKQEEVEQEEVEQKKEGPDEPPRAKEDPPHKKKSKPFDKRNADVAGFLIFLLAIFVVGWALLASGAVQVEKVEGGRSKVILGKPTTTQMKAKTIQMYKTIKAKSIETFATVKAKATEKFGSKKVQPNGAAAPGKAKEANVSSPEQKEIEQNSVKDIDSNV